MSEQLKATSVALADRKQDAIDPVEFTRTLTEEFGRLGDMAGHDDFQTWEEMTPAEREWATCAVGNTLRRYGL